MKRQKTRITAAQFDQALLEQIRHARGMNVPVNALSSAASFCVLVHNRLFGDIPMSKKSGDFVDALQRLIQDARDVRTQERADYQREQQQIQDQKPRIIVPGDN